MKYKFEETKCNVCGSANSQVISKKGQHGLPVSLVLCIECGLGYLNPRWDSESYKNFYKYEYDKYYRPHLGKEKNTHNQVVNPIVERINQQKLFPQKVENILDIGSGEGRNLDDLRKLFPFSNLYAIEPSLASQAVLEKSKINFISDDVESHWEKDFKNTFDIVIMRHVLEHFLDPAKVLIKVRKVLADDGILYLSVPNSLKPAQFLEYSWFRVVHTYYFNKYSLQNLMSLSNLFAGDIIEGDEFNRQEVYLVAKKAQNSTQVLISKKNYIEQKRVFEQKIKKEKTFKYRVLLLVRKTIDKLQMVKVSLGF